MVLNRLGISYFIEVPIHAQPTVQYVRSDILIDIINGLNTNEDGYAKSKI